MNAASSIIRAVRLTTVAARALVTPRGIAAGAVVAPGVAAGTVVTPGGIVAGAVVTPGVAAETMTARGDGNGWSGRDVIFHSPLITFPETHLLQF